MTRFLHDVFLWPAITMFKTLLLLAIMLGIIAMGALTPLWKNNMPLPIRQWGLTVTATLIEWAAPSNLRRKKTP